MGKWFLLTVFITLFGFSKAHHFIRIVILAGLGLAGLWMIHTLAQDFNHIHESSGGGNHGGGLITFGGGGGGGGKELYKRSVDNKQEYPELNWDLIISRDPASCARSFICQLTAQKEENLDETEKLILELTRYSAQKDNWSSKQLHEALKNGQQVTNQQQCMKIYKFCPYTSQTMMHLLRVFGS